MKNHELIEYLGGTEGAKWVLNDAPNGADSFEIYNDVIYLNTNKKQYFSPTINDWAPDYAVLSDSYSLDRLRTAIAEQTELKAVDLAAYKEKENSDSKIYSSCMDCGSLELYKAKSIREPRMCFECFAAMTGFIMTERGLVDMDELEDLK